MLAFSPFLSVLKTPVAKADSNADAATQICNAPLQQSHISNGDYTFSDCYAKIYASLTGGGNASKAITELSHSNDKASATDCLGTLDGVGIGNCVAGFIYIFTVGLGSGIAYVGANFFNFAAHLSLNSGAYSLDFISAGWTTARDIANMAFIFILVYLAITIMFQANTAGTMHTLANVIIIALLINFSFFFTRLVIDAGNILSVQFYNAITAGIPPVPSLALNGNQVPDLTAGIMQGVNIQTALNSDSFKRFHDNSQQDLGFIPYVIALSFLYISIGAMLFMLAGAFFTAGAKFVTRIVMLWFMIIASPLALVARASGMRSIERYYHSWQETLIKNAFYPAAFLFIFWLLSKFMGSLGTGGAISALFADLNSASGADAGSFMASMAVFIANLGIRVGFVIAMIYIALEASKRFGVYGAAWAENFGKTMSFGGGRGYVNGLNWINNRKFMPGALPGAPEAVLKRTAFGNSALGYGLRTAIAKPLANAHIAGLDTRGESLEKDKKGMAERTTGLRDIENRKLVDKAIQDPKALSPAEKDKINHFTSREFGAIGEKNVNAIASLLTEEAYKRVHSIDSFSEQGQDNIHHSFHEKSSEAPLQKANELIEEVRLLGKQLGGPKGLPGIKNALDKNTVMDKANTKMLEDAFKKRQTRANIDFDQAKKALNKAAPKSMDEIKAKAAMAQADKAKSDSREGLEKIKRLKDEGSKVPAGISTPNKGEFAINTDNKTFV